MIHEDKENSDKAATEPNKAAAVGVKRDFFGRIIAEISRPLEETQGNARERRKRADSGETQKQKVWVSFHEGLNNAVRKPISLEEFLQGL